MRTHLALPAAGALSFISTQLPRNFVGAVSAASGIKPFGCTTTIDARCTPPASLSRNSPGRALAITKAGFPVIVAGSPLVTLRAPVIETQPSASRPDGPARY